MRYTNDLGRTWRRLHACGPAAWRREATRNTSRMRAGAMCAALLLFVSTTALGSTGSAIGKITRIQLFSSDFSNYNVSAPAFVTIYLDELPPACGTGERRVILGPDHPLFSSVYSTALAAYHAGDSVRVWYFNTCTLRPNSWDFSLLQIGSL